MTTTTTKLCSRCGTEKPATLEFFNRQACGRNGLRAPCKECQRLYTKAYMARRIYDPKQRVKWLYGIDKAALLEKQQFMCANLGCQQPLTTLLGHIDHDHACCPKQKTCGQCVRGILCPMCNKALGQAKDSLPILKGLVKYLESYQTTTSATL